MNAFFVDAVCLVLRGAKLQRFFQGKIRDLETDESAAAAGRQSLVAAPGPPVAESHHGIAGLVAAAEVLPGVAVMRIHCLDQKLGHNPPHEARQVAMRGACTPED